ncbi:hypothetical protein RFI_15075 [Reticulomyxa filosa]|uniref:P-type ATPase C-terminal domain-containing protein n=1 Tax=Reticulomyxa filosa TaxID=46433 RepID=X6N7U4_RETFI|nr:hypothetical protein RFI_15075 [Reticulomyxa filosa]|eukprot:ETO22126.1 hypothetical protein RFI_15075 [Reticulomyxa filosa]
MFNMCLWRIAMERTGLLFRLTTDDRDELLKIINSAITAVKQNKNAGYSAGMVVTSTAVQEIMAKTEDSTLLDKFLELSTLCKSVLAVRMQPNQKAQIIELVKTATKNITLAVGDGANDEPMIRVANVGVGIAGLEGTAAVRASDYAIAKVALSSYYNFDMLHILQNGLLSLSSFWFGLFNGFSGQVEFFFFCVFN